MIVDVLVHPYFSVLNPDALPTGPSVEERTSLWYDAFREFKPEHLVIVSPFEADDIKRREKRPEELKVMELLDRLEEHASRYASNIYSYLRRIDHSIRKRLGNPDPESIEIIRSWGEVFDSDVYCVRTQAELAQSLLGYPEPSLADIVLPWRKPPKNKKIEIVMPKELSTHLLE